MTTTYVVSSLSEDCPALIRRGEGSSQPAPTAPGAAGRPAHQGRPAALLGAATYLMAGLFHIVTACVVALFVGLTLLSPPPQDTPPPPPPCVDGCHTGVDEPPWENAAWWAGVQVRLGGDIAPTPYTPNAPAPALSDGAGASTTKGA